jgi:poly-gamma-glutamate synthesis protein (capsule biosynthesis protein)
MIWSRVGDKIDEEWLDFVFSWTQDFLSKKDIVVLNLENPVTNRKKTAVKKSYNFKVNYKHLLWLKTLNNNLIVNLANNHIWDYWEDWILDTFKYLDLYKIAYFWAWKNIEQANSTRIFEIKGLKIWFIWQVCIWPNIYKASEIKAWSSFFNKEVIEVEINKAKKLWVDLIVYNMHCWDEYRNWPNKKQRDYAHFAIDSWADLIIWHHPHRYQWIEKYKDKLIFYSLWDYIFDIDRGRRTKDWIIVNVTIKDKRIKKIEIIPTRIKWFWSTSFITNKKTIDFILNEIYKISKYMWEIETIKKWYINL